MVNTIDSKSIAFVRFRGSIPLQGNSDSELPGIGIEPIT